VPSGSRSATFEARSVIVAAVIERASGAIVAAGATCWGSRVGTVVGTVGAGGGVVVGVVGPSGVDGASPKVTGTNRSSDRSDERVWSARVTTAQRTWRQSIPSANAALTVIVPPKAPPAAWGVATPSA
jgi:hypothetical protein